MGGSHVRDHDSPPRVFVFLKRGLSLESWSSSRSGDLNSPSPYGYAAASGVVRMSWSTDAETGRAAELLRRSIRRVLGFDWIHAWRHRHQLAAADVVWTHTEWESLAALAVLRLRGIKGTRVIAQTVWLWDEWETTAAWRKRLYLRLLDRAAVEVTLSTANRDAARAVRGSAFVTSVPFGAAVNNDLAARVRAQTVAGSGSYVLAVGSDRHRDWETLHAAARMLPDMQFRVATLDPAYPRSSAPENVTVTSAGDLSESYRQYVAASIVVLPLRHNLHASGCTVAIEAQALGVPLVTTDVGGIDTYLDRESVALYPVGDAAALAESLRGLLEAEDRGAGIAPDVEFVARAGLTADDYAARFVLLTRWIVDGGALPEEVSTPVQLSPILRRSSSRDEA